MNPQMPIYKRALLAALGCIIISFSISCITVSNLGTATISTVPFVLNKVTGLTIGTLEMFLNFVCLFAEICILKRKFPISQFFIQVFLSIGLGVVIDLTMVLVLHFASDLYLNRFIMLMLGIVIQAFGVSFMILSQFMMPLDALCDLLGKVFNKSFGFFRTSFDISLTSLAAILSFFFLRKIVGIREGTVLAALLIGNIANIFIPISRKLWRISSQPKEKEVVNSEVSF